MNINRALAKIVLVDDIRPIENAERIELAIIKGWQVVVKKNDFKKGDLAIYFEIDALLPIRPEFEFLRASSLKKMSDGREGFRIKTMKMRGQLSQGLLMPLSAFPEVKEKAGAKVDTDVTNVLNVTKYEVFDIAALSDRAKRILSIIRRFTPECVYRLIYTFATRNMDKPFPEFITRTDEERIQNCPTYFGMYNDEVFEETEKLDGMSATFFFRNGKYGVCSRNTLLMPNSPNGYKYNFISRKLNFEKHLRAMNMNIALQGEICGEGIAGNKYKIKGCRFFLFSIYLIDKQRYANPEERSLLYAVLKQAIGTDETIPEVDKVLFDHVPVVSKRITLFQTYKTVDELLARVKSQSAIADTPREGNVYKAYDSDISFKVINNDFLLQYDE